MTERLFLSRKQQTTEAVSRKKGKEMMVVKCDRPQVISSLIYLKKLLDPSFAGSGAAECRFKFVLPLFASVPSKLKVCTSLMPTEALEKFHSSSTRKIESVYYKDLDS